MVRSGLRCTACDGHSARVYGHNPVMVIQPVSIVIHPVMAMQPVSMVIQPVLVMQPVSIVRVLSGAVGVYG